MDITRKLAVAIVMIIPAFVIGGLIWSLFGSWWAVLAWEVILVIIYSLIISGKLSSSAQKA
ncbi:MAG: hypothetical protein GY864_04015 [Desulfobacterales bacterium]|nr:hypothetical protein [Desulfobacterales bacterium]